MIYAKVLKEIIKNDDIVGYRLRDTSGTEMNVDLEQIKNAIKLNKIQIENLSLTSDNKLEYLRSSNKDVNTNTTDVNTNKSLEYMKALVEKLNKAIKVYEQGTDEIMSNYEYDKLYDELLKLEEKTGTILSNSPTQNVGYEVVSKLPKEKHSTPMLSLDKTKDRQALKSWLNGKQGVLSWKMDGLTVVLTYENGELVKGVTRGNGEVGEVVTPNVKRFKNIPKKIVFKGRLVLRGEAIIKYSSFNRINSSIVDEEKYKNPRNLCSGSVRQLDSKVTAKRDVEWYCFSVEEISDTGKIKLSNDIDKQFDWLKVQGFDCVEHELVSEINILDTIESFSERVKTNDIPTDGLVLTYRDKAYGKSLGQTNKFPRHSIAFKWQDENVESTIEYIEWSPSRTGLINPIAVFKPVDIEGSTVSRASVHNLSIFLDLQLGYGDTVSVYKANLIIPQISDNLTRSGTCEIPGVCPCCGCELEVHEEPTSGVLTLWCPNQDCLAKGNKLMEHFVTRDAMNIDGISGSTINTLVDAGIVTDLVSIYHIKDHQDEIVNLDGFGIVSFTRMVNAIEKSRDVKIANLIYALGIPNIGLATAKLICKNFNFDLRSVVNARYEDLITIDGIGEVIANSFIDYFTDSSNRESFVKLVNELNIIKEEISEDTTMAGVTICVTGDVYIFSNRRVVKDIVEKMGGKLTGSVSRSTTYLVTNDTSSGSRKNQAAKQYGIPILTEKEFIDKFNITI